MTDGGWTRTPRAVWMEMRTMTAGRWSAAMRAHDLLVWDEAARYDDTKRPSGRELARTWGVSEVVARRQIAAHDGGRTEDAARTQQGRTEDALRTQANQEQPSQYGTKDAARTQQGRTQDALRTHGGRSVRESDAPTLFSLGTRIETETETRDTNDADASYVAPDWWPKVKLPKGCVREQFRVAVVEAVKACRGTPPQGRYPSKADAEVCASLFRSCQPQTLQSWAADLMLVLDAAHNANVDPFDWLRSKGIHQRLSTMTAQKDWPDRLHAAKQWDAKGRPKVANGRKPIVNTPIRQMTMQESDEELRAMGIDPDEIPF